MTRLRPIGPCQLCGFSAFACTCPYFHLRRFRTPFVLLSHLNFTKTPEQLVSEPHPTDA